MLDCETGEIIAPRPRLLIILKECSIENSRKAPLRGHTTRTTKQAVSLDENNRSPIIVVQFMAQQINCIRNKEGDVIEGAPDDIRAYYYVMAFQRDYDEKESALIWRVIDFQLGGGEKYY